MKKEHVACQVKMGYLGHLDHQVTKGAEESKDTLGHEVRMEQDFAGRCVRWCMASVFSLLPPFPHAYIQL